MQEHLHSLHPSPIYKFLGPVIGTFSTQTSHSFHPLLAEPLKSSISRLPISFSNSLVTSSLAAFSSSSRALIRVVCDVKVCLTRRAMAFWLACFGAD